MDRDRWEHIERLYHAALERAANEREAFLEEACAGDEALRHEVAGLLECDRPSDSFIQSPAIEIAARAWAADPNESHLPKPEPRPVLETLNFHPAGGLDLKNEPNSGLTGRRRIISVRLIGLLFTLMSVGIGVNSCHSISYFTTAGDPAGWWIPMVACGRMAAYRALT